MLSQADRRVPYRNASFMINDSDSNLQAALKLADFGLPVLPLHSIQDGACTCNAGKLCGSPGKHPLTAHGTKDATLDVATITRWWTEAPSANVGIATGAAADVFVIGPDGQAGL